MVYFLFVLTIKWVKINLLTWRILMPPSGGTGHKRKTILKPMLKKDFFSAIENLLKAGFQPRFYTVEWTNRSHYIH